ncbi:hypothetical protein [Desulfoluna limicola]|uniref:hypothetical protein n=1 Tax=Desulfoluna limicola TaxID=2810562 RepID=UPI001F4446D6|nr:hypothetical protein [Desulfoluna limicola]
MLSSPKKSAHFHEDENGRFLFIAVKLIFASGGPAGGKTFEKFDKQVLRAISVHSNALAYRLILNDYAKRWPDLKKWAYQTGFDHSLKLLIGFHQGA